MEFQQLQEVFEQARMWFLDLVLLGSISTAIVSAVTSLVVTYCLCHRETAINQLGHEAVDKLRSDRFSPIED